MQMQAQPAEPIWSAQTEMPLRVLVVDDSRLERRILRSTLSQLGYHVIEVENAEEALQHCAEALPDVVISDWMMPGMTGLDFCAAFREVSGEDYRYFILLTSKSDKEEIAEGLDAGADDFLVKPVSASELRARIGAGARVLRMQRELTEKNRLFRMALEELQRLHDVIDRDLLDARQLQQALVKERSRSFPEGQLSLLLRSAGHVGGDLVGFFPTDDGKLGLYAIDVSGHGISSALMTARLAGTLSASAPKQNVALARQDDGRYHALPPSVVIDRLNEMVCDEMQTEHYLTLLLAFVDLNTGRVTLTQAGHPHPLVQRADGSVEQSGTGGFPVGLMGNVRFEQTELQLAPGDRLLLLSDGVTECPGADGSHLGEEGLARIMDRLRDTSGMDVLDGLVAELSLFAGTKSFPDDVSGVLFEYSGPDQKK